MQLNRRSPVCDYWRPLPKRRRGKGLVTIGRPLGRIIESPGANPIGYLNRGGKTWSCDIATYQLLELAQRGCSEKWLKRQLTPKGVTPAEFAAAKSFALQAGLLREYRAVDSTIDGKRSLRDLIIRRRLTIEMEKGVKRYSVIPEGEFWTGRILADWAVQYTGHTITDSSMVMLDRGLETAQAIWWPFWEAIRCLELGLIWFDVADPGAGVKDGRTHFLKPASLWNTRQLDQHQRASATKYLKNGPVVSNQALIAMAVPLGNDHQDDRGFVAINHAQQEVELSPDAYALLCDANGTRALDIVSELKRTQLMIYAHGRVLAAAEELEAKNCLARVLMLDADGSVASSSEDCPTN